MGDKYLILAAKYPLVGYTDKSYQTRWFIVFMVQLIHCLFKYEDIDVHIRNIKRMDRIDRRVKAVK